MELNEFIKNYNLVLEELLLIDYANYKIAYDISMYISNFNWELALIIMINIIKENPKYFDETIRDSIFLSIQNEGNRNTYKYIIELLNQSLSEDVISYFEDMKCSIEEKYSLLNIRL